MKEFRYNLLDFLICKDISSLKSMKLFIWGAAKKGIQIKKTLDTIGISTIGFCDSDDCKRNKNCEGIAVIGPDNLKNEYRKDPEITIILCVSKDREVLNTMERQGMNDVRIISYWGIKTACVTHQICLSSYAGLPEYDEIWEYKLHNNFKNLTVDYFLHRLKNSKEETIWILQVGKTASSTLEKTLDTYGKSYIKEHTLHYPKHILSGELQTVWESIVKEKTGKKLKIITAVREPLARDYSAFWQAFSDDFENAYTMNILNKDIQIMYDEFIRLLLNGYAYSTDYLGDALPFCWRDEFEWFKEEVECFLNIDIYQNPFDPEKGYQIIEKNGISIFLFKVEMLHKISEELQDFVGKEIIIENDNRAEQKSYYLAYKEFRKKVKLSKEYVEHYYKNNIYMNHFYSSEEKKRFLDKWRENIDN